MYRMLRVFCATAWELEAERHGFCEALGQVNQEQAMARGTLFVPVALKNVPDKRRLQAAVDENIRACSYYILAIEEGWGPSERNFERDYRLAIACRNDKDAPMRETAILVRDRPDGSPSPFGPVLDAAGFSSIRFATTEDFRGSVLRLLTEWLAAAAEPHQTGAGT